MGTDPREAPLAAAAIAVGLARSPAVPAVSAQAPAAHFNAAAAAAAAAAAEAEEMAKESKRKKDRERKRLARAAKKLIGYKDPTRTPNADSMPTGAPSVDPAALINNHHVSTTTCTSTVASVARMPSLDPAFQTPKQKYYNEATGVLGPSFFSSPHHYLLSSQSTPADLQKAQLESLDRMATIQESASKKFAADSAAFQDRVQANFERANAALIAERERSVLAQSQFTNIQLEIERKKQNVLEAATAEKLKRRQEVRLGSPSPKRRKLTFDSPAPSTTM